MSDLPQIVSSTPVVVPAVAEKTYPDLYITGLNLQTGETPTDQSLIVGLSAYNYTTKELAPRASIGLISTVTFIVPNIWVEAARVPLFAQVMGGIVTVVNLMKSERDISAKIAASKDVDEIAALTVELQGVQQQLGIV